MTTLTITHTAADGTLLEGTSRGDGAYEAIKAAQASYKIRGWKYFPSIRAIGVSHSRDRAPKLGLIDVTADVLREAGFTVDIVIDGAPRAMEDAEADRAGRMDDRAAALHAKAGRKAEDADARWAAADAITDGIPMGQPILVGHHSERGHRRALKTADAHMRKSLEVEREAKSAAQRAATAERHMEARNNPRRVYRRIRALEADRRKAERELTPCTVSGRKMKPEAEGQTLTCPRCYRDHTIGADLLYPVHGCATGRRREEVELRVAHLAEQIRYWGEALDAAKAAGADVPPDTDAIKKGWWVKSWAGWRQVTRVNKVTVSIRDTYGNPNVDHDAPGQWFSRTLPLDEIREIRETSPYEPAPVVDVAVGGDVPDAADAATAPVVEDETAAPDATKAVVMQVCPTCDGSGAGSASMRGPTCAAGMCGDCRGEGEVTAEKRARLLAVDAPADPRTVPGTVENIDARADARAKGERAAQIGLGFDLDDRQAMAEAQVRAKAGAELTLFG